MRNSRSSNESDLKKELLYYPNFTDKPLEDQDFKRVEQKHLCEILNGEFSDLFEDEDVEQVWIYYCPLKNEEGARIGATVLRSAWAVARVLSLVPVINLFAFPFALAFGTGAHLSAVIGTRLQHQFVLIKTKKWFYVVAKGGRGCAIYRGTHSLKDNLLHTQKQYQHATRLLQNEPTPKVLKDAQGKQRLFAMIRWMKNKEVIDEGYDLATKNCKHFAQKVFDLLTRCNKEIE